MPISRAEVIKTIDELAAPLGPQTSFDERLARQDRWVDDGGTELLDALLGVVASPPREEQVRYSSYDDWNTLLVEVTGTLGKKYSELALQRLLPLLDDADVRATVIDILGSVGESRAVPRLGQLMQSHRLGEDDLVHLAGALGEIGGEEACRLLAQLRQTATPAQRDLQREIDVAVQVARCD
jgi:HEAT repeat protein